MAAPSTFVPDETSDEQPSFSAPASFVPDEPAQAPASTFSDPAETIAPLSRWKSLKFGTEQALEKVFPGMAEKGSPSPVAVASQAAMIAPLGLPERLGKLLMGYFTARTAYDQPAIARQIRDEVKQGDLPAAKRTAIEDLLNVGMVGTGIMGLRGGKQPATEGEPAITAVPAKMPEGEKPATFIPETPQPIGGDSVGVSASVGTVPPSGKAGFGKPETLSTSLANEKSSTPSLGSVQSSVGDMVKSNKILDPVVALIPVNVMDVLGGKEAATEMLLHNQPMLRDRLATNLDRDVFVRTWNALRQGIASERAKLLSLGDRRGNADALSALDTIDNNLSKIGGSVIVGHEPTIQQTSQQQKENYAVPIGKTAEVLVGQAPGDRGGVGAREVISHGQEGVEAPSPRPPQGGARADEGAAPPVEPVKPTALESLPPPKPGMTRMFSGNDSSYASTNPQRAAQYAQAGNGSVRYVDVPDAVAAKARQAALKDVSGTAGDHLLPNEWVKQQKPVAVPMPEPIPLEAATPSEPVKTSELIKPPAAPGTVAPSGAVVSIKNVGDNLGFTYDGDFAMGDVKLHQFTFRNLPKTDPAYGASFYAKQGASPEEVLALAEKKAAAFREAAPKKAAAPPSPTPSETPTAPVAPSGTPVGERQPAAAVKPSAPAQEGARTRELVLDNARQIFPFGETAKVTPTGDLQSTDVMAALGHANIPVAEALKIISGEKSFPTREQFEKGVDRKYWNDATDLISLTWNHLRTLGLTKEQFGKLMPQADQFKSGKDYYDASKSIADKASKAGAGEMAALIKSQPKLPSPTIKSPLSAFGKQFYKNTAGEWRQKGKPNEPVNSQRRIALEQLLKPKEPAMVGMGGAVPSEFNHPETGTTGAGQDIYGIAARVRKARASAGQVAPIPTGQGIGAEDAVKWGQELIRNGVNPEKSMQDFERTRATSFDLISMARGYGEALAKSARDIESQYGTDSLQYRTAQKALSDWDARSKAMQTEWHKQGMAQQGETDIDTGSFTGINRAYREVTGEDLPATHVKTAKGIVKGVKDADAAVEKAKPALQTAIDGIAERGKPVKVAADLDSQQKEFQDYESDKPMTPLQVKTLWTRAKTEYIDKDNVNFGDTIHKLADDLGIEPKDVLKGLSQTKQVKRIADDVWQKQRQARMLKQAAKRWIEHSQETWMQKALPTVAKTMFSMKVGLHGTVAMGTHAPLIAATHPIIFKNNFGKMYKLVASPEYYQMQTAEMARRPNYTVAQRNGLVNDMSKMEDFNDPQLAQGFPKMAAWFKDKLDRVHLGRLSGMGTRGYSVLKILRQDLFDHEWNKLPESMKSDSMAKAISDSVNHITGVTKAGAGKLGKAASYALFAPKLQASRVAVMVADPVRAANSLIKMSNMTPAEKWFAKNQFKQSAKIFAVGTSLMLANQQLNNLFGDQKKLNGVPASLGGGGWNPMQSDFMKFRVAGMNFAWGSPFLTMARLPLRIYQIGAGSGGKTKYLIYPDESMYKTTGSYLRTQASPFLSPIISVITKGDYQDRPLPQIPGYGPPPPVPKRLAAQGVKPYTWTEFISDTMLPIPVEQAVNEVWHDHGLTRTQAQGKSAIKPFITFLVTAGTGGRLTEDWTPKKSPLSE